MKRFLVLTLALSACSGAAEYGCPDPVGKIILDDCEIYKTRYESLRVELGASLGPMEGKIALGQQALREPSELLQVLAHRTFALCRDFNACRVVPLEYRQRREQTDCIFTAVSAIQTQLAQDLDAANKARLVKELVRVLGGETCGGPIAVGGGVTASSGSTSTHGSSSSSGRREFYSSSSPWYGTRLLPPQPPSPAGFPRLVWMDFDLEHVFRQESPHGIVGYRPRVRVGLLGQTSPDDMVTVDWGGQTSECSVGRVGVDNGMTGASCQADKTLVLTGAGFTARVGYRRGLDGKSTTLGQQQVVVLNKRLEDTRNDSHRYGISHEEEVGLGMVVFRPKGDYIPPAAEQPSLYTVLRVRKDRNEVTARCWVDGKLVTGAIEGRRGHLGQFQDRPRYRNERRNGEYRSSQIADPFIKWVYRTFTLPFVVQRDSPVKPEQGEKRWPLPGSWRCVVTLDGELVRELTFKVKDDGRLVPHPQQTARARAGWLVQTRILSNSVEGKVE